MNEIITIASCNCQGLGGRDKRKDVLIFFKQRKYAIYCIQDTHFTEREENYIRAQWGFDSYFSSYDSQSRGTAILLNNIFEHTIHSEKKDNEGNKVILDISLLNKRITLINIYGPNRDQPGFYEALRSDINTLGNKYIILAGDFNLVMSPEKDTYSYVTINNPNAREKVLDIVSEYNLIDIWREFNKEKRRYTWRTKSRHKQARLDFFLISENLMTDVSNTNIEAGYRSDHSLINISLKGNEKTQSKTFWKLNNSLLKDIEYTRIIKQLIDRVKLQYTYPTQDINNVHTKANSDILFTVNDQLFFETLLMEIRGKTISYSTFKKKQTDRTEQHLIEEINKLEENNNDPGTLDEKKTDLESIRQYRLAGSMVRSRAKWIEQGEQPTQYFCSLECRNFVSKVFPNIIKSNGEKTSTQTEILNETKQFFMNLYSAKQVKEVEFETVLEYQNTCKLNPQQRDDLEGEINRDELLRSLKGTQNGKSPGSDGFTAEFF